MRKIFDIHGGVHPPENKVQSLSRGIESAGIPPVLVHPLSQHIGAPATPIVEVGQRVLKGQMIADAKGFVSAPVHASSSGTVSTIEHREIPHPSGLLARCIVIDTDGKDEWIELDPVEDYTALEKADLLHRIRDAGIAGMGGAGFPSAVKLSTRDDVVIDTLIINGTECEPYITADDILMRERADQIIAGVKILQHLIQPTKQTLIGVEDNKPEGIAALRAAAEGSNIEVVVFPTKYPSGGEKQLIQILTGREVPSGGLPADIGVVCQNIGTTVAIHRAVQYGEPLISRITTVTGEACSAPGNFEVLLGTPVDYLLKLGGFQQDQCIRLVMGGPMMGFTLRDTAVPVVKTTNCLLAPTQKELPPPPPAQACIRCGMCAEACPVSLLPQQMYWFARGKEYEKLEEHNLFDCIECGACSYACPSNIPLVQYYRASKAEIRKQQQEKVKSEHAKARFEARQIRIEREEAEKEARRKARQEAAKKKAAAGKDPIKAAQAKAAPAADPAQAAIEKAMAKRSGNAPEETNEEKLARLKKAVETAEKRLESATAKLKEAEAADAPNLGALQTAHERMTEKFAKAKEELQQFEQASTEAPSTGDPAADAIARAQAARAKNADKSPREKAEEQVASLEKRLSKSEQKLAEAKESGSETAEVLEQSTAKLRDKLDAARAELAQLSESEAPVAAAASTNDPAQLAIEKAMAAREAAAKLSPEDKAKKALESLEARVEKTRTKLAEAEESGADTVDVLRDTLAKLEDKLAEARKEAGVEG
ncbi:electron transport complex protein RnfC [Litorivivens lipolytica]|uniref:Ion-translocating oxidoreductase complex subunit C n=1 Tax=Litorivivens lipolytica TaxID=1524264 RepID=A0A7W4W593_9GAMM|nr:electron transport complex subunit RsxC [Litorivivens lipolytica]MBB3047721.1 electron transport complex protein RnfC [Litorivivens lipolytica]